MQNFNLKQCIQHQFELWPELREQHEQLKQVNSRQVQVKGHEFRLYHLPHRVKSSTSGYQKEGMVGSPLEDHNLQPKQQSYPVIKGFSFLINPFPIFPEHGIIRSDKVVPQAFYAHIDQVIALRKKIEADYALLYNGTLCGASIPQHWHMHVLPSNLFSGWMSTNIEKREFNDGLRHGFSICSNLDTTFATSVPQVHDERLLNVLVLKEGPLIQLSLLFRKAHRHRFFPKNPNGQGWLISPGVVDVLGHISCVRENDMKTLTPRILEDIFEDIF